MVIEHRPAIAFRYVRETGRSATGSVSPRPLSGRCRDFDHARSTRAQASGGSERLELGRGSLILNTLAPPPPADRILGTFRSAVSGASERGAGEGSSRDFTAKPLRVRCLLCSPRTHHETRDLRSDKENQWDSNEGTLGAIG